MIFRPDHIQKIINKILGIEPGKDQTRRLCRPGERFLFDDDAGEHIVLTPSGRLKWRVGDDYAVSPGRGKPGVWVCFDHPCYGYDIWDGNDPVLTDSGLVDWRKIAAGQGYQPLRIRLLEIRREPLWAITEEGAVAEGCEPIPCMYCGGQGWMPFTDMAHNPEDPFGSPLPVESQMECSSCGGGGAIAPATEAYKGLWESINGPKSWDKTGDVWVLRFEVVK